jgi:hypothetical protein
MNKDDFVGKITFKGDFSGCGESIFEQKVSEKVKDLEFGNDASYDWYLGKKYYETEKGKVKDDATKDYKELALKFTQMVWKGTKRVGFGVKDRWVIAWYCEDKGAVGDAEAFKKNVGKMCVEKDKKMNSCYNDKALKKHNEYRKAHSAKDLELDKDMAEVL